MKKGFTLIELLTTFVLSAVIIVLLINIINIMRGIYNKTDVKTELYILQGNISNALNKKINKDNVETYYRCNDASFCYTFELVTGETIKVSATNRLVTIGNVSYNLPDSAKVSNPTLTTRSVSISSTDKNDSFLVLNIPIECSIYPETNFGINLVYQYNSNKTPL